MRLHPLLIIVTLLAGCHSSLVSINPAKPTDPAELDEPAAPQTTQPSPDPAGIAISTSPAKATANSCRTAAWRQVTNSAFKNSEHLAFRVRWTILSAGKATLKVEGIELIQGRPAYHVSMDIRTTGATASIHPYHDRTDSWLDQESLATRSVRHAIRETNYQLDELITIDPLCGTFRKERHRIDKGSTEHKRGKIPPYTSDLFGAVCYLRTQALAPGQKIEMSLFVGDRAAPVTAIIGKRERINIDAGTFDCYSIDFKTPDQSVAKKVQQSRWWVTSDPRHIPVRIQMDLAIGHIVAELQK